jgi:hypothetical protein
MKRTIAFGLAMVMAAVSVPVATANAASAYAQGDVDMDGLITGHDAAMVSLYDEGRCTLTDAQLALADVNADGVVDATDAGMIYDAQEYPLGDLDHDGYTTIADADLLLQYWTQEYYETEGDDAADFWAQNRAAADIDCNGVVSYLDIRLILNAYAEVSAENSILEEGTYHFADIDREELYDLDMDGEVTLDDVLEDMRAYVTMGAHLELDALTFGKADVDGDNQLSLVSDSITMMEYYGKKAAGLL